MRIEYRNSTKNPLSYIFPWDLYSPSVLQIRYYKTYSSEFNSSYIQRLKDFFFMKTQLLKRALSEKKYEAQLNEWKKKTMKGKY